jgi:protein-S-isoprenylcysteine O-methyltransferase Ste14
MVLMWLTSTVTPETPSLYPFRRWLLLLFLIVGLWFALAGVLAFRRARTTVNPTAPGAASSLVTAGVYRVTRNPMYVGFLCFLIGWGFYLTNLFSLIWVIIFMLYMTQFQIKPEEHALAAVFKADFITYAARVRRWL